METFGFVFDSLFCSGTFSLICISSLEGEGVEGDLISGASADLASSRITLKKICERYERLSCEGGPGGRWL